MPFYFEIKSFSKANGLDLKSAGIIFLRFMCMWLNANPFSIVSLI